MRNRSCVYIVLLLCHALTQKSFAQDTTSAIDRIVSLPNKLFSSIDQKTVAFESRLYKQTTKYLNKLQRQEARLKKKLYRKDSTLAKQIFQDVDNKYNSLQAVAQNVNKYASFYSGHLDSITTALNFLKSSDAAALSSNPQVAKTLQSLQGLQERFNQADQISKYLQARQRLLKEQFQKLGMVKELRQFRKQVYYYEEQMRAYKQLWESPGKLEAKLMEVVLQQPQFKEFFARNSQLGSLFALPSRGGSTTSLQGLQTRAMLNEQLTQRFGSGAEVTQMLQQNFQAAQSSLSDLKSKVGQYASGSFGNTENEMDMPDFKPNTQKTKSFWKRLEWGGNIQSQKARSYFPVTSDVAATLGYRLNDQGVAGVGISGKVGLGHGWNDIKLSMEGYSLRSFLDVKIKGSFFLSGGYELNQWTQNRNIDPLMDDPRWQKSGLVGLTKKYNISKKMKGNAQLLWDFLSYRQIPRTQAVIFRTGYSLK